MRHRLLALALCAVALVASCAVAPFPRPRPTDEALSAGRSMRLPLADPFPRLGLQWTYEVSIAGFPADHTCPARIAYRLTAQDELGHPWAGWWIYGEARDTEFTGAKIEREEVLFAPPRLIPYRGEQALTSLDEAPRPLARPGSPGTRVVAPVTGGGSEATRGTGVVHVYYDIGRQTVEVAAGRFDEAWYVEGRSPGWTGRFWWVENVGWARLLFTREDGARVDLELAAVKLIEREPRTD